MAGLEFDDDIFNEFAEDDNWADTELINLSQGSNNEQALIEESNKFQSTDAPSKEQLNVLHKCFGHKSFRPMQWKIINSIINDRRDNCAIMATGYGKSLCYQYPAVFCGGVTVVISPLISLMEDQVFALNVASISACLLGSAQKEKRKTLDEILDNKYSVVYMTPEYCCGDFGLDFLKRMDNTLSLILIAIDEAHCVSTWGHDFRFSYRNLGTIRKVLSHIPILAVTATATPRVRNDITKSLMLRNAQILCSGFDRPNLYFVVHMKSNNILNDLKKYMLDDYGNSNFDGSTIIYCITKKHTEEVAELLMSTNIKCAVYHASLTLKVRKDVHEQFLKDKLRVIVATIAFGMGIDKPDVRQIIHYGASKDIESYYQEVGRAGRDGQPSRCITFYSNGDFNLHKHMLEQGYGSEQYKEHKDAMGQKMARYLDSRNCRRQFILDHFQGKNETSAKPKPNCCDNCTRMLKEAKDCDKYQDLDSNGCYDFTEDSYKFISAVSALNGKFGIQMYVLFLKGSNSSKLYSKLKSHPLYGSGTHKTEDWWKGLARILEREKYLTKYSIKKDKKTQYSIMTVKVTNKGESFLETRKNKSNNTKILLQPPPELIKFLKRKTTIECDDDGWIQTKREVSSTKQKPMARLKSRTSNISKLPLMNLNRSSSTTSVTYSGVFDESPSEKEDDSTLYRLLKNKRSELANKADCMPYLVASNEVLLQMVKHKPTTIHQLRNEHFDGMTEAKISKFGEEFLKIIRSTTNSVPKSKSLKIEELIAENPLPDFCIGATATVTYSFYTSGLSIKEIADKRGLLETTVLSHLIDAIKMGYPVKLIDLNVTDEIRNTIVSVIRGPLIKSDTSFIQPIKQACPPDITYDNIRIVVAYLNVRSHLNNLNLEYKDFESPIESLDTINADNRNNSSNLQISNSDDVALGRKDSKQFNTSDVQFQDFEEPMDTPAASSILCDSNHDEKSNISSMTEVDEDVTEQPKKKFKFEKFHFKEKKFNYCSILD